MVRIGDIDPEVYQRETVIAQWETRDGIDGRAWSSTRGSETMDGDSELLQRVEVAMGKARYLGEHAPELGRVVPA